jgi:hypothetical protein
MSTDLIAPRVVRISAPRGSAEFPGRPDMAPRSASAPVGVGQIHRPPEAARGPPPAAPPDAGAAPAFDPFGPEAAAADAIPAQFAGVVDFAPILREYVRPPEAPPRAERPPALRSLPPFPRFDTTVAAQTLGAFVRAEFGVTATFALAAGWRGARDHQRSGAHEEAALLPSV